MRRIVIVIMVALSALSQVWGSTKELEKGQYDLILNGINKGFDRYKILQDTKTGLWSISSEVHFKLPMVKAKRGYVDLMIYPILDLQGEGGKLDGYRYRMKFEDFSKTDLVEAQGSATEMIDQDMRNYDYFNRTQQLQEDEMANRIDLGVNAGSCVPFGNTLHFSQTKFSTTRVKDEPLPAQTWIFDAYCFSLYLPLARHARAMKGESEPLTMALPQAMHLTDGRLEYLGVEKTPFRADVMLFKHFDVMSGGAIFSSFWLDKAGKLVQISVPSEGLVAAIAKYAPQPFEREEPPAPKDTVVSSGALSEQPVRIAASGASLGATLTLPSGQGPFPAVLMVHDLVSQDRDGNDPSNPYSRASTWKQVAYDLAAAGFASLRSDSRGVGESTGDVEKMTWEDRVGDVAAQATWLAQQPTTRGGKVLLLSLGLGGWECAQAAGKAPVSGLVAVAFPAKEIVRLWKEQVNTIQDPDARLRAFQEMDKLNNALQDKSQEWSTLNGRKIYLPSARAMMALDPAQLVSELKVPCLFVYPERDTTVMPFHRDVLTPDLHAGQETLVLPGISHYLTVVDRQGSPTGMVDGQALAPVIAWMAKLAGPSSRP